MRDSKSIILSILIQSFTGLCTGFLAGLLVYFKQKELFHIGILLFLVTAFYYAGSKLFSRINIPANAKFTSLVFFLVIGMLGPQFIYQVRPYTFYVSGIIIGAVTVGFAVRNAIHSKAIENNVAYYDAKTSDFTWKDLNVKEKKK